jgi:UDP-N-acetylmuramate dehydrogenase
MKTAVAALSGIQEHVPLAPYTTFKIGGPARYFVVSRTVAEVQAALTAATADGLPWFILGGGSDVLVADTGFRGLAIKLELRDVSIDEAAAQVRAGAGLRLSQLITQTLNRELVGLEFAIGVPASVGGAVWANLGARGSEIKDLFVEATVLTAAGEQRTLSNADCQFGYRDSIFKHQRFVVLDALFQLRRGERASIQQSVAELSRLRKTTQDLSAQTAGCVFRNPKDQTDVPAAKLIDDLDLKGKQIGGAKVSEKHANFIVNAGGATASDVVQLISYVKQQVRDKAGVQLMEEIDYIGFD